MRWPLVTRARYERDLRRAAGTAKRAYHFAETLLTSAYVREAQSEHFGTWASGVMALIKVEVDKIWELL